MSLKLDIASTESLFSTLHNVKMKTCSNVTVHLEGFKAANKHVKFHEFGAVYKVLLH